MTPSSPSFFRSLIAAAVARAFTPPPDIPIWQWADDNVWLQNEDAAEPGPYRSAKTRWTRRLQELARRPFMWVWSYQHQRWERVRVREVNIQKSTQSGFTESILNFIRWLATFMARNVIYAIDSLEEAKKIARRLLRSLKLLDPEIFTGDPDDIKSSEFLLRGMELLFYGSFSSGKFANKQAPILVADELEEHSTQTGDTTTEVNLSYRKKTATGGIQFNLSKPKLEGGPINVLWKNGNREEFHIECPHCGHLQYFTYHPETYDSPFTDIIEAIDVATGRPVKTPAHARDRAHDRNRETKVEMKQGSSSDLPSQSKEMKPEMVYLPKPLPLGQTRKVCTGRIVYEHCRNVLGELDELRLLTEVYYECAACKGTIEEDVKDRLVAQAAERDPEMLGWLPTAIGSPGIVSQHMSDLCSTDEESTWGQIVIEIQKARKAGRQKLQGVINNRLGNAWREELSKTEAGDILANVAGRELWFIDVPTDRGYRRDVFDSSAVAETSRAQLAARGIVGEITKSYCPPYKRGTIPFVPAGLIIGSDVGGNYARWVLVAAMPNRVDLAVIDWADEIDPETIGDLMVNNTWPCHKDGKRYRIMQGFIDAKFRKKEVLAVCWQLYAKHKLKLTPTSGAGGMAARGLRVWALTPVNSFFHKGKGLKKLDINDREAKNDVYITCLGKKHRRIFFPVDLFDKENKPTDPQFVAELCAERLIPDRNGLMQWDEHPPDPNHYGDALKNATTGLRYLTRKHHAAAAGEGGE